MEIASGQDLPFINRMIKLEISVIPKDTKRVEFSQSLSSLQDDLQRCCPNLVITTEKDFYFFNAEFKTEEQLKEVLLCKKFGILAGAIRTLGETYNINIHGDNQENRGTNLSDIGLNYLKNKKTETIK